jgi:hypothetical protein
MGIYVVIVASRAHDPNRRSIVCNNWRTRHSSNNGFGSFGYSLHVMEDHPLPADYAIGRNPLLSGPLKEHLYPWDLDILAKELVLNAGSGGDRSLKRWSDLVVAINHLRRLDDAAYAQSGGERVDVMFELHRIAHRQFPWQMKFGVNPMMRAFKVFGEAAVSACSNAFFNPPLRLSNKPMVSFFHYKS